MEVDHHRSDASRLLAEAGKVLTSSLDYNTTLEGIARLAISEMADWCSVDLCVGGTPRTLIVEHRNPENVRFAKVWRKRWPNRWDDPHGAPNVIKTGKSEIYKEITDKNLLFAARDQEHLQALRNLNLKSVMIVPLIARTRIFGAITFLSAESGKVYSQEDLFLAEELGRRGGVAIDNALLFKKAKQAQVEAERGKDRITRLQEVTSALSRAVTQSEIGDVLLRYVREIFKPDHLSLALRTFDNSRVELTRSEAIGNPEKRLIISVTKIDASHPDPSFEALRYNAPLFLQERHEVKRRFPQEENVSAMVLSPLTFQSRSLGALRISYSDARVFSTEERSFFSAIAQHASQALERARLFESELALRHKAEDRQHRLKFLAEASMILSENLDHLKSINNIVAHAVPYFADACVVDMVGEDKTVNRIAISHIERDKEKYLREIGKTTHFSKTFPICQVLSSGDSILLSEIDERNKQLLLRERPQAAGSFKMLQLKSLISVRLGSKENPVGVMSFLTSSSGRIFCHEDVMLAEELGRRATIAIENARLYSQAKDAISIRDEFLSIASHELKTPLTSICLQLQLVKRNNELSDEKNGRLTKAFEVFDRQSDRLSKLIDSLLDVSLIQAGKLTLQLELIDISDLLHQILDRIPVGMIRPQLEVQRGIQGFWDRSRLDQVFTNLISNAIKYGAGKPILVKAKAGAEGASISVHDHGAGIAKEDQSRIFDRFQRAVSDRTTWGMGLGLYIAKQIVEAHHGKISLQSEPGMGSIFTVDLPRPAFHQMVEPMQNHSNLTLIH